MQSRTLACVSKYTTNTSKRILMVGVPTKLEDANGSVHKKTKD